MPAQPGENLLEGRSWQQIQGDRQNRGFNGVHTTYTLQESQKWITEVGKIAFSSPVISPLGDIWVGTSAGELIGMNKKSGQITHQLDAGGSIVSTPAVADDGRVYFLSQNKPDGHSVHTHLQVFDPATNQLRTFLNPDVFQSTCSPKIWRDFVFVSADNDILVFDRRSVQVMIRRQCCQSGFCTEGNFITDFIDFFQECFLGCEYTPPPGAIPSPSIAIVDDPAFVSDPNHPIIVMAGVRHISAFDFDERGATEFEKLSFRWQQELQEFDCDARHLQFTTPAVLDSDEVVIADDRGRIRSFQIENGSNLWNYDLGEQVMCPPVASFREIYVVGEDHFAILDSNGIEMTRRSLHGRGGGAALSLDLVHVLTSEGIQSFDTDPDDFSQSFHGLVPAISAVNETTPAIDSDGSVYVSLSNGEVAGYGPPQVGFLPLIAFPQVSWKSPVDGATLSLGAGRTLRVSLPGGGFSGDITIESDIDGPLCNFSVQNAAEASCVTTKSLTPGDHQLTAFATNQTGGTRSAEITIHAVNTPPTVQITSPPDGANLASTFEQTLSANVSDVDEGEIPADRIVWTSDLDGELGHGKSIQTFLGIGTHLLTCTATDEHEAAGHASVTVLVSTPVP